MLLPPKTSKFIFANQHFSHLVYYYNNTTIAENTTQ